MFRRSGTAATFTTALLAAAAALVLTASTTATAATAPGSSTAPTCRRTPPRPGSRARSPRACPSSRRSAWRGASGDGQLAPPVRHRVRHRRRAGLRTVRLGLRGHQARRHAGTRGGGLRRRLAAHDPGGTASWQDYGTLPVEEGAHVYGVHISIPDSEPERAPLRHRTGRFDRDCRAVGPDGQPVARPGRRLQEDDHQGREQAQSLTAARWRSRWDHGTEDLRTIRGESPCVPETNR